MRTNRHVYGERALWVKGTEAKMAKQGTLTVIIREGDRSDPVKTPMQWLPSFESIPVYCIAVPGDQVKGIAPQFEQDEGIAVKVVRRTVTQLLDIKNGDLNYSGGFAVPRNKESVERYLREELSPGKTFSRFTVLTIYWVVYLPKEPPALD